MHRRSFFKARLCVLFGLCGCLALGCVRAQEAVSSAREANEGPDSEQMTAGQDRGIIFPIMLTTEVFGNITGGTSRTAIWESLLNIGVRIDFEKAAGVRGLSVGLSALYPQGSGLTSEAVHDFNTLSNIDGYDSLRLYEAWFQEEWSEGKFSLRVGQILADADFFASEYGALFISSSFGAIPLVSKNLNPPIFPVAAPGLRLRVTPRETFYAEAAVFSGDAGEPSTTNKHNTRFQFRSEDGVLVFAEIGYKRNPKEETPARPDVARDPAEIALTGTYKLGGIYDSRKFLDSGGGPPHRGDCAIYFIADQELWHPAGNADRALSFFGRVGAAPNDRNTVAFYGDTGFNFKGMLPRRDSDTLGLGFSYARLSADLVDESGRRIASHHEAVLELTYQATVRDHISLQPDLQFIFNPGAFAPAATAIVTGLRLSVKF